jgi:D-glycero-D-manno-heptose 1,7-bisphosphate phosphatase
VGGLGARLKHLTRATPKPLIDVAGRPFLDTLIEEAARQGFNDILLLGGYLSQQLTARYDGKTLRGASVHVLAEPEPLGTGGALKFALPRLAPKFLLANGDTFFDINLRALVKDLPEGGAVMALRNDIEGARYGRVGLEDGMVRGFHAPGERARGPINGGIYALDRTVVAALIGAGPSSLEGAVFPRLARDGMLRGRICDNYFIDIGIPEDLERARSELPSRLIRPALFLDRDGTLNVDTGYLHRREDFEWIPGAREAVRVANDKGWLVFVVTNQSGVARGFYEESDVRALHAFMDEELAIAGAHIDAYEYCPHHPDGARAGYNKPCDRRKPGAGMIRDLLQTWPVDASRSIMIGDAPADVLAGEGAGIRAMRFPGGDLLEFAAPLLD